ncbi:gephyrin-like molybdotransferase Glp [Paenibacillus sp. HB172176]|uniref:molybdopterin molybdotransferase MoeA n=1 Tax=Paenibacillus sp. HB172176 TaxID=2493690 RepID=UPI001F0F5A80|nr:gephyrin-like molybdotransferase Glp [Paenibacillus sp. HB172176]
MNGWLRSIGRIETERMDDELTAEKREGKQMIKSGTDLDRSGMIKEQAAEADKGREGSAFDEKAGRNSAKNRFARRAISVEEAQRRVLAAADKLPASELVPLAKCGGRRLAKPLRATSDWPPFARAGLDGYAVRAADTARATPQQPATLRVVSAIAAGGLASATIEPGTAARIMTGAAVPAGADAVVMLEQTAEALLAGGEMAVHVKAPAGSGQNVAPRGEEFRLGSLIAEAGDVLRPGHIALFGTFGYAEVPVLRRPRVAVFATGSELLPVEAPLEPGRIRDSNSPMLAAMIEQSGGEALLLGTLPDDLSAVEAALNRAWGAADLVVTTGGVSVGDYDVMADLLRGLDSYEEHTASEEASEAAGEELGAYGTYGGGRFASEASSSCMLFNRVSMRPGSPTSAAYLDGGLLLSLSGNPGACYVGFELFVRPLLRMLQGERQPLPRKVKAILASDFPKGSPHARFIRVRLVQREDGRLSADPLAFSKSSMMASIAQADGLVVLPSGSAGARSGEMVDVLLLPNPQ